MTKPSVLGEPAFGMQQVHQGERFPNVAVTVKGTVLAVWGSASIKVRRSEDGGVTWGPQIMISDPGFMGGGVRVSLVNCLLVSSMQTSGRAGSCGRV